MKKILTFTLFAMSAGAAFAELAVVGQADPWNLPEPQYNAKLSARLDPSAPNVNDVPVQRRLMLESELAGLPSYFERNDRGAVAMRWYNLELAYSRADVARKLNPLKSETVERNYP